ncbi:dienelactone hydrolase family protein [Luteimonas aquatica]|uniref:dienelactone hydrolase family protein n=1 Tax=Luteimonas aquatica TaxID=450364 RepID=UPI001F585338|nr:dienelactone hydrolase family protein [Luteimonas aquatica]
MGEKIEIQVEGVGPVGGWLARPAGPPRGALVVIQEIFGVNAHIRAVAEAYARDDGFLALAPAFFDPIERDLELDYGEDGFRRGRELIGALGFDRALAIVSAAADHLRTLSATPGDAGLRVGAVGFCWGGTLAYLANTRLGLPAVSYYGARTVQFLDEPLRAPMMFHFGEQDHSIPAQDVARHRERQPEAEVFVYPAGHGFNRDVDPRVFDAASAELAHARTLALFRSALS